MAVWPHRLAWSRTPDFHSDNRGSNPLGVIVLCVVHESLAQSVEHLTFNEGVDGSSPSRLTFFQDHLKNRISRIACGGRRGKVFMTLYAAK